MKRGCECPACDAVHQRAPLAYVVERDGVRLQVCTRCILGDDIRVMSLFDQAATKAYLEWDSLGTYVLQRGG